MKTTYRLRPAAHGSATLYCRVTCNTVRCKADFTTGLSIKPENWNRQSYRHKSDRVFNRQLEELEADLFNCYLEIKKYKPELTGEDIRQAYLSGRRGGILLADLLKQYVEAQAGRVGESTLSKYRTRNKKIMEYLDPQKEVIDLDRPTCLELVERMRLAGHDSNYAAEVFGHLKRTLAFAVRREYIPENPARHDSFSRKYPEDPPHLTADELRILELYPFADPVLVYARDLFVFMCHTGMYLSDVFSFSLKRHVRQSAGVMLIDRKREKPPHERYILPFSEHTQKIAQRYGGSFRRIAEPYFNRSIKQACYVAGIEKWRQVSNKWGRKTAAHIWLNELCLSAETVTLMMGHSDVQTTLTHYTKIREKRLLKEWERVA